MVRSYRYHATLPPVVVDSEDADAALGPGWFDHPDTAAAYAAEQAVASGDPSALPATLDGLSAADAAKLATATDDVAVLQAWLDAEMSKPKPRASVTRVLGERLETLKTPE